MTLTLLRSIKATLILAVLLCGVYPAVVWLVGVTVFHDKSSGGILYRDGKAVGAHLIGQSFVRPEYFHGRPSAAGDKGYDAANSGASNLGPTNQKLADRMKADIATVLKENPTLKSGQIPVDLVTASASGLDPHISPESAEVQVERVAAARKMTADQVRSLVAKFTEGPQWGLFGEPTVHVLRLNLALDEKLGELPK